MTFPRSDWIDLDPYEPGRVPIPVDLSDNTSLWGPHPSADRALRDLAETSIRRYPSTYADRLKAAVANRFGVPEECITTGCGSDDILDSAFRAVSRSGGSVSYLHPTFSMIEPLARVNGLDTRPVEWNPWETGPPDPSLLLEGAPDLVYICRPNNPTGVSVDRGWVEALLRMAEAREDGGPLVLIDEAYADFGGESMLRGAVELPRALVLRTMSKAYGLAGLRVGFAVGSPAAVREIDKSRGPYKVSAAADAAAAAALEDESGWIETVVQEAQAMRGALFDALRFRGFDPLPSDANFLLVDVAPRTGRDVLRALRDGGVSVRPFDVPGMFSAIRVTVAPWELLERFLMTFDQACETLGLSDESIP